MYLFVYGTLRRGVDNKFARLLARTARYIGPATVRGRLYRIGQYPGLVAPHRAGDWVRGDVYAIDHPAPTLRILDAYEGTTAPNEFKRTAVPVLLDSGERLDGSVYLYMRSPAGLKRITSGDFLHPGLKRTSAAPSPHKRMRAAAPEER